MLNEVLCLLLCMCYLGTELRCCDCSVSVAPLISALYGQQHMCTRQSAKITAVTVVKLSFVN